MLICYSLAVHDSLAQNSEDVTALLACGLSNTSPSGMRIREETIKCLQVCFEIRRRQSWGLAKYLPAGLVDISGEVANGHTVLDSL